MILALLALTPRIEIVTAIGRAARRVLGVRASVSGYFYTP